MSGKCVHCKGIAYKSCVGCKESFVCDLCEDKYPCAWCNHPGPYCDDCDCINNHKNINDCGEPTNYACWGCEEKIPIGDTWYKCCDDIHDGRYCCKCIQLCPCGDHNICNSYAHLCNEGFCDVMLCLKNTLYEKSNIIYCDKHIPEFKPRVIQHILRKYH